MIKMSDNLLKNSPHEGENHSAPKHFFSSEDVPIGVVFLLTPTLLLLGDDLE